MSKTFRYNGDQDASSRRNYEVLKHRNAWRSETRNSAKVRKLAKKQSTRARRRNNLTNVETRSLKTRINAVAYNW